MRLLPREVSAFALPGEPVIARIKLFGMHTTGARGIPYYAVWVLCGPASSDFTPQPLGSQQTVAEITNAIFEVY